MPEVNRVGLLLGEGEGEGEPKRERRLRRREGGERQGQRNGRREWELRIHPARQLLLLRLGACVRLLRRQELHLWLRCACCCTEQPRPARAALRHTRSAA